MLSRTRTDLLTRLAFASRSRSARRSSGNFNEIVCIRFHGNTSQSGALTALPAAFGPRKLSCETGSAGSLPIKALGLRVSGAHSLYLTMRCYSGNVEKGGIHTPSMKSDAASIAEL